jgi:hypothetical protein
MEEEEERVVGFDWASGLGLGFRGLIGGLISGLEGGTAKEQHHVLCRRR